MTDSFTKAYDAIFEIENHGDGIDEGSGYGGGYDEEQSAEYLNNHSQAIIRAITIATEAEQLRKERDELAAFIRQKHDVLEVPTEIFNLCIQNR